MGALTLLDGEGDADGDHKQQPPLTVPSSAAPSKPPESAPTLATHTRTIGIIHSPHDIRVIIDKTATLVVKRGLQFERHVVRHHPGNAQFNFLKPSDPYHAYYQHRISQIARQPSRTPPS